MMNNIVIHITTFSLLFLSLSLSGMQQNNQTNALQRWRLTITQNNFDKASKLLDEIGFLLEGHMLSGSLENHQNTWEVSFKLKGAHNELVQKLKDQPWFSVNNLREEQKDEL